jgi:acetyl-CoA carboxylase biotin carboxyl carrier protein
VDLARLRDLIQLMDRNQLAELEIEEDGVRIRLRKKGEGTGLVQPTFTLPSAVAAGGPAPVASADGTSAIPEEDLIRAPMVGTFYRSPSPESDPFVEVGDRIEEGKVLGIIEAMKVMNEVKAERSGTIEAVLAENGEPVEYGTPLFRIS